MAVLSRPVTELFTERRRPAPDVFMFVIMALAAGLGRADGLLGTRERLLADSLDPAGDMRKQLIFAAAALVVFAVTSLIDYPRLPQSGAVHLRGDAGTARRGPLHT